jgi:hypothetical protein
MMHKGVLLDTSFFIRFLNESDPLFKNADGYFRYFIEKEIEMYISTISIAEYCVIGDISELPLRNLKIVPFNFQHATRSGEFAGVVFKNKSEIVIRDRKLIPNDTKLFGQADVEKSIELYLTSDLESLKVFNLLKNKCSPKFQFVDLNTPYNETFGVLDFN